MKLFFLGESVPRDDVAAALPDLELDRLEAIGVLEPAGGSVRALLRLVPHKDVLVAYDVGGEPPVGRACSPT
jgi:hypothetical protein